MDVDPWWLILVPLLFGLGWIAARVDIRQMLSETRRLPDSYFRGLNFLLNEQPDHAIDAFIEVVKLDPETIELHFALGSLFRRRGELERAIRVHQNLIQRNDLPARQREQALYELAQDHLKAGMLDRAEEGFLQLQGTPHGTNAVRHLIRIYEAEHDWSKAIAAVQTLQRLVDEPVPQALHYHCELAEAALARQPPDREAALAALDAAAQADERHEGLASSAIRALGLAQDAEPVAESSARVGRPSEQGQVRLALLRARMAMTDANPRTASVGLDDALQRFPAYAGLLAEPWLAAQRAAGAGTEGLQRLQALYREQPSQDLFDAIFRALHESEGATGAWRFARQALERQPSLLGLERLLEAQLEAPTEHSAANGKPAPTDWISVDDARLVRRLIHRPAQRLGRYACQACGFRARRFYWQCPGCNTWETYLPRRLEELEGN